MPEVSYQQLSESKVAAAIALATENPVRGLGRVTSSSCKWNWKSLPLWRRLKKIEREVSRYAQQEAETPP